MTARSNRRPEATGDNQPAAGNAAPVSSHDSAARVLRRFRVVFNAVRTHFQQVERDAGVGGAQLWALSVVAAQPGLGVGALAAAMDIHQTTASNLVRSLKEAGLLRAERDGLDRRSVRLKATPRGRQLLRQAPGPFSGVLPQALAGLDSATLMRLEQDLDLLILELGADRRAGRKPLAQM